MRKYTDEESPILAQCFDCGLPYEHPAWIEALVTNEVWAIINPTYHEHGGLLCITCIADRCFQTGLTDVQVAIAGGTLMSVAYEGFKLK